MYSALNYLLSLPHPSTIQIHYMYSALNYLPTLPHLFCIQIHYMDPEDILDMEVEELVGLDKHADSNEEALKELDRLGLSYRYSYSWLVS